MKILIKFRHGLGDAVQLTSVVRRLKEVHLDWHIAVAALVGKHTAFYAVADEVMVLGADPIDEGAFDEVRDLVWRECFHVYADHPSTKAEQCLKQDFGVEPELDRFGYTIGVRPEADQAARAYLDTLCGRPTLYPYPVVVFHYQGNTSRGFKDLDHETVAGLCQQVIGYGMVPVILDWDQRSPLPDAEHIYCPSVHHPLWQSTGTGDAERIAALVMRARLFVGVDSGPQKVAAAVPGTPSIAVWRNLHPIHYCCPADHVTHLVPRNHAEFIRATGSQRDAGIAFFNEHYRYRTYNDVWSGTALAVADELGKSVPELVRARNFWVRGDNAGQDLVIIEDVYQQDCYRLRDLPGAIGTVIDAGAHIGAFGRLVHELHPRALVICVEAARENLTCLEANAHQLDRIRHAALDHSRGDEGIFASAVYPDCVSTGGSIVMPAGSKPLDVTAYRPRRLDAPKIGLGDVFATYALESVDVLKMDIEGSEIGVLEQASMLGRVHWIVGEYHDRRAFDRVVGERLGDWRLEILRDGQPGLFRMTNPTWPP